MAFKDFLFFWKTRELSKGTVDEVMQDFDRDIQLLRHRLQDNKLTSREVKKLLEQIQDIRDRKDDIRRKYIKQTKAASDKYDLEPVADVRRQGQKGNLRPLGLGKDINPHPALKDDTSKPNTMSVSETTEDYTLAEPLEMQGPMSTKMGIEAAGPIPNSLLADQDLDRQSSTEKGAITKSQFNVKVRYQTDDWGTKYETYTVDADSEDAAKKKARDLFDREYPSQGGYFAESFTIVKALSVAAKLDSFLTKSSITDKLDSFIDKTRKKKAAKAAVEQTPEAASDSFSYRVEFVYRTNDNAQWNKGIFNEYALDVVEAISNAKKTLTTRYPNIVECNVASATKQTVTPEDPVLKATKMFEVEKRPDGMFYVVDYTMGRKNIVNAFRTKQEADNLAAELDRKAFGKSILKLDQFINSHA